MRKILPFVLIILILTPSVASAKISLRDIGNSQINSDYEKKIIIGKISNIVEDGPNIIFTAVNIRTISFSPFTYIPYISNESITISKAFIGILKGERIFGIFLVLKDEGNDNFKIICDSEIIKIYWYRVEKIWENENMTTLKVSVLHESIVNRTVSFNETFQLYNDQDELMWSDYKGFYYFPPFYKEQWVSPANNYTYTDSDVEKAAYAKIIITEIFPLIL